MHDSPPDQSPEAIPRPVPVTSAATTEPVSLPEPSAQPEDHLPMLDIHPPHHAASTWRDFFIHIATIVLGLIIAVGIEQTVEFFHHRHQVAETRELLRNEREDNRQALVRDTKNFRVISVELQNNLQVLDYLSHHPGTPDEKLPGTLLWLHGGATYQSAAWDEAQTLGVTSLMPREEVAELQKLYAQLRKISDSNRETWLAINDAERYSLIDSRLSNLTPTQITDITTLTQIALTKHFINGLDIQNMSDQFKDFPPSLTLAELFQLHHNPTKAEIMKNPAYLLTFSRLQAAGFNAASFIYNLDKNSDKK
jgi:hypothetical protein